MDIEHFISVLSVAKHSNFTEAAYEISTSQSTVSKNIKAVENSLGIQLFRRSSRKVELTPAGDAFVKHARRILAEFEDLKSTMREYRALESGSLSLGCIGVVGRLGLTSVIADFQRKYPGIQIELKERNTTELIEMLQRSQIDIAILSPPLDTTYTKTIDSFTLVEDEVVVVVDELHPFAKKRIVNLAEAQEEKFILLNPTTVMHSIAVKACKEAGYEPNIIYESTHIDTVIGLVSERLGISLLPRKQVTKLSNIALVTLEPSIKHTTSIAFIKQVQSRDIEKAFIDHCLKWSTQSRLR